MDGEGYVPRHSAKTNGARKPRRAYSTPRRDHLDQPKLDSREREGLIHRRAQQRPYRKPNHHVTLFTASGTSVRERWKRGTHHHLAHALLRHRIRDERESQRPYPSPTESLKHSADHHSRKRGGLHEQDECCGRISKSSVSELATRSSSPPAMNSSATIRGIRLPLTFSPT